jgi:hypothetical protein
VVSEGRAAAEGVLSDVRVALADQIDAIGAVAGSVGGGTDRLVAAGQALLAYLADRDRALERERDRVLHDVLEEFASGLTPRERRAVASRVGEAVDRHRDSRDAARYRRTQAGEPEPDIPSVPGVIARLSEPVPTPPPARRSSLRPAPRPAPKKTSAKKAAPKKAAPAAKSAAKTGKVAPAKATTAKKAAPKPAGRPAAKKAAPARKAAAPAVPTQPADEG